MVFFSILLFSVDVEHSHVRFLGNLVLNLWDCGGQESFMEQYFASQKDNIFRNVEVLIYVFDVESRELDNDMHYYQSCLEAIYKVNYNNLQKIIANTKNFFPSFLYSHRIHRMQKFSVWCTKWIWWLKNNVTLFLKNAKKI